MLVASMALSLTIPSQTIAPEIASAPVEVTENMAIGMAAKEMAGRGAVILDFSVGEKHLFFQKDAARKGEVSCFRVNEEAFGKTDMRLFGFYYTRGISPGSARTANPVQTTGIFGVFSEVI
jgi:hypothetical protein